MSTDDSLPPEEITARIARARALIQEVRDESAVPSVATSAHQADILCHRIMWELGAESATTPELEEPIERDTPEAIGTGAGEEDG
jgi:hypothetical protein